MVRREGDSTELHERISTLLEMKGAKKEGKYSNIRHNKHLRWVETFEYSDYFQYEKTKNDL